MFVVRWCTWNRKGTLPLNQTMCTSWRPKQILVCSNKLDKKIQVWKEWVIKSTFNSSLKQHTLCTKLEVTSIHIFIFNPMLCLWMLFHIIPMVSVSIHYSMIDTHFLFTIDYICKGNAVRCPKQSRFAFFPLFSHSFHSCLSYHSCLTFFSDVNQVVSPWMVTCVSVSWPCSTCTCNWL